VILGVCETTEMQIEQINSNAGQADLKFFNGSSFEREIEIRADAF